MELVIMELLIGIIIGLLIGFMIGFEYTSHMYYKALGRMIKRLNELNEWDK
jgi:hypothetical protein